MRKKCDNQIAFDKTGHKNAIDQVFTTPPGYNKMLPVLLLNSTLKLIESFESHLTNILFDTSTTSRAHS